MKVMNTTKNINHGISQVEMRFCDIHQRAFDKICAKSPIFYKKHPEIKYYYLTFLNQFAAVCFQELQETDISFLFF